ncbi:MAG: WD40 repeat domain-containing protein [Candidatus Brachytrichaceae bacterium NZ_4S206]|jgi:WD40 repeat protein
MIERKAPAHRLAHTATVNAVKRWSVVAGLTLAACTPAAPQRTPNVTVTPVPPAVLPAIRIPDQAITLDTMARIAPLARLGSGGTRQLLPSPDGGRLAIVAEAGVHTYDAAQLSPQHATTYLDNMSVTDAAFSPTGETLAIARSGGTYPTGRTSFVLLDATSGRELRRWDNPAAGYAEHLALAPRGERFATTLFDIRSSGQIAIVNAQSGQIERTIPITRPEGHPFALHFLANGRLLFSQGEGLATLDPAGGAADALRYPADVARVAVSANGRRLAVLLTDGTIQLASAGQGDVASAGVIETYRGNRPAVREMALSPAGDRLAIGLAGGVVELWELRDGSRIQHRVATGMPEWQEIWLGELAIGEQALFLEWPDNYVERWEPAGTEDAWRVQRLDHMAYYIGAAFATSADLVALGEGSGLVRLWRMSEGRIVQTIGERLTPSNEIRGAVLLAISPDGARVAIGFHIVPPNTLQSTGSALSIWDVNTGRRLAEFSESGSLFVGLAFSPDGATLAVGLREVDQERGAIKLWRAAEPGRLQALERLDGQVVGPTFTPDGRAIIAAHGWSVTFWDAVNGRRLDTWTALGWRSSKPVSLALSSDGATLVVVAENRRSELAVLDVARREVRRYIESSYDFFDLALSPIDDLPLAAAGTDGPLWLLDLTDEKRGSVVANPLDSNLRRVAFAPDGKILVTVASDGTIVVWGVPPP